jgi:hypothetical protein
MPIQATTATVATTYATAQATARPPSSNDQFTRPRRTLSRE